MILKDLIFKYVIRSQTEENVWTENSCILNNCYILSLSHLKLLFCEHFHSLWTTFLHDANIIKRNINQESCLNMTLVGMCIHIPFLQEIKLTTLEFKARSLNSPCESLNSPSLLYKIYLVDVPWRMVLLTLYNFPYSCRGCVHTLSGYTHLFMVLHD